jgi:translation initiation factor 4B
MTSRDPLPLPTKPPYTAHLGNLPFDAEREQIEEFFQDCEVTNVRIVEDKIDRRPKGFGYVEFNSLDGLKRALELNSAQFRGRGIKISVADPREWSCVPLCRMLTSTAKERDRGDRPDAREITDWTRKGPLPDLPGQQQRRASDRSGFKNYEAPEMERGGSRRGNAPPEGDGKVRDFNNWERRGPLSPIPAADGMRNAGRVRAAPDAPRERKNSPSWGDHRSQEGSRPPKGEFRDRPQYERQPTAAELDNEWRSKMRPDAAVKSKSPTPSPSIPSSPATAAAPLAVRPKLNLAKRTVSEAEPAAPPSSTDSKASPFGAARPIDTATRERQVEEKRQQAIQKKKKEMEDKAKEDKEKQAREAAAKTEKTAEKDAEEGSQNDDEDKANGADASTGRSNEVLSKLDDDNDDNENEKADKAPDADARREGRANGSSERGGRPRGGGARDGGREPPRGPRFNAGGSWRGGGRKPSNASNPTSPATPDEEGWSTVPPASQKRGQRSRGGQQSTRAAAS